jgi:hypothetical protein
MSGCMRSTTASAAPRPHALDRPLQPPHDRLRGEDAPRPGARRARLGHALVVALPHPLAGHLDEPELAHGEGLGAGPVAPQVRAQLLQHPIPIGLRLHVDEVADDDAPDVPQAELARNLAGGLAVGLQIVFSGSFLPVYRPEFTSIETSASVCSMIR